MPAPGASTVACPTDAVAPAVPTVTDNCGRTITPSAPVVSADPACGGTKTYTYTFTDCAGVAHQWVYTYKIGRPSFTVRAPGAFTVACSADTVATAVTTVTENCVRMITP